MVNDGFGQRFGNHDVCVRHFNVNCGRGRRAFYAKCSCDGRCKSLKNCWQFICLQSTLSKPGASFLNCVESVVGNQGSEAVQTEIHDEPKRSIQSVRSSTHTTVHISLVVDSALFMQQMMRPLTRRKTLVLLPQYQESFLS